MLLRYRKIKQKYCNPGSQDIYKFNYLNLKQNS